MSKSNLYQQLVDFKNGKITNLDIHDDNITDVKKNGLINIHFDIYDFFEIIFDDYNNNQYVMKEAFGNYGYGDFIFDYYRVLDDWNEGYIIQMLDDANTSLILEISELLNLDEKDYSKLSKLLYDNLSDEFDLLLSIYQELVNDAAIKFVKEYSYENYCDLFFEFGIYSSKNTKFCFKKYSTNIDRLINLYEFTGEKDLDLKNLLHKVVEKSDLSVDEDLYELIYDNYFREFDNVEFQQSFNIKLNEILQDITESSEKFEEYNILKNKLKYKQGVWYDLPKNPKKMFKINKTNINDLKIYFDLKEKGPKKLIQQNLRMSYENFLLFLYHPELF
jgi:hypothetical protein